MRYFIPVIVYTKILETPVGGLFAAANDAGVFLLDYLNRRGGLDRMKEKVSKKWKCIYVEKAHPVLSELEQQLNDYFDHKRNQFDLPLCFSGTDFQQQVFTALSAIPYGATISYQQLAREMQMPTAIRAIAKANGENNLAILVPCHRVVASSGLLTGYSGGVEIKKWLLDFEHGRPNLPLQPALF